MPTLRASRWPVSEYAFANTTDERIDVVFSFHTKNFMKMRDDGVRVERIGNGVILYQEGRPEAPWKRAPRRRFHRSRHAGRLPVVSW